MISFDYRISTVDGRQVEITATAPDFMRFEREFGVRFDSFSKSNEANIRWHWHGYLAWCALRRRQPDGWPDTFDGFLDVLEDIELKADDETPATAPDDSGEAPSPESPG